MLSFNGSNYYVNVTNNLAPYINNEITIATWIYPRLIPTSGHDYILDWYHTVSLTTSYQVCIGCGYLSCKINGTTYFVYGKDVIPENQWIYIVGTRKENIMKLYKNGILENEKTDVAIGEIEDGSTLYIAQYPSSGYQFNGFIDDVRIYAEALPSTEIQKHYVQGLERLLVDQAITKEEYIQRMIKLDRSSTVFVY
jgi:hypothetical protein